MGVGIEHTGLLQIERINEIALPPVAFVDVEDFDQHQRRIIAGRYLDVAATSMRGSQSLSASCDLSLNQCAGRRRVRLHQVAT